ncbi:MAG: alpha-hydroxy-acid oxidizing protein [Rhodospirillaceae bacterium]|nr:alpha-hydroxy-acid oxidizing protein [Rhodospirillaceae bacterium]
MVDDGTIKDFQQFETLHEFAKVARDKLSIETWDYLMGGADTETTLKRNRLALDTVGFRPRVMRDVEHINCGGRFLGQDLKLPIILAPVGALQDFDPDGGVAPTLAAADAGVLHMLSSRAEPGLEAVAEAIEYPKLFQLYVRGAPDWVDDHIKRAMAAGYVGFAFTVDLDYYGRRERDLAKRYRTTSRREKQAVEWQYRFTWDDVKRIKDKFDIPLILKGIATAEDAALCVEHGIDVVYVSNHGGRQLDHGRGGLDVLPEVIKAVDGKAEVAVDGGFMRGSDVVKAMAMGADAVGLGRLQGMALGADGRAGVVRMLELLETEIKICLGLLGVTSFDQLDESYLHAVAPVELPGPLSAFPLLFEDYLCDS